MFPSLESYTLEQLEKHQSTFSAVGWWALVFGTLAGLIITLWWQGYGNRIGERIAYLEKERDALEDAEKERQSQAEIHRAKQLAEKAISTQTVKALTPPQDKSLLERNPVTHPNAQLFLYLGTSVHWVTNFPHAIIEQQREQDGPIEPMLTLSKNEDGILVTGTFFDQNGDALCRLEDNEITIGQNVFRKKQTDHSLVVFDKQDYPVIDVEYIDMRTIRILGNFYFRDSFQFVLTPKTSALKQGESEISIGNSAISLNMAGFINSGTREDPVILLKSYDSLVKLSPTIDILLNGAKIDLPPELREKLKGWGKPSPDQPSKDE